MIRLNESAERTENQEAVVIPFPLRQNFPTVHAEQCKVGLQRE